MIPATSIRTSPTIRIASGVSNVRPKTPAGVAALNCLRRSGPLGALAFCCGVERALNGLSRISACWPWSFCS